MKRNLILIAFFVLLFGVLCLSSCSCGEDGDGCFGCMTVSAVGTKGCPRGDCFSCMDQKSCFEAGDDVVELNGCYVNNNCVDCFWAPKACGCYENEISTTAKDGSLSCIGVPSCVIFGFDFTLLEFYEPRFDTPGVEKRKTATAESGADYTVDRITLSSDLGDFAVFTDGDLSGKDLETFIKKIMMYGENAKVYYTVEFTALTELHSAECGFQVNYEGYEWNNFTTSGHDQLGNTATPAEKVLNIQPGKHVMCAVVELDLYEIAKLEGFTGYTFNAMKYVED